MPRKFYIPKNRYVKNSNLDEDLFLSILRLWCEAKAASAVSKDLSISKVTVHKYYQALGTRALQSFNYRQVCAKRPDLMQKLVAAIGHLLNQSWDYEEERKVSPKDMKFRAFENIPHMTNVLRILRPKFQRSFGLDQRVLASYIGYASLIMAAGRESGLEEIADETTASKFADKAYELYLNELVRSPLDLIDTKAFLDMIGDF